MAHVGFKALQAKIERQGKSPKAAAAIAATVGRRKFGKEGMARLAAEGKRRASASTPSKKKSAGIFNPRFSKFSQKSMNVREKSGHQSATYLGNY